MARKKYQCIRAKVIRSEKNAALCHDEPVFVCGHPWSILAQRGEAGMESDSCNGALGLAVTYLKP